MGIKDFNMGISTILLTLDNKLSWEPEGVKNVMIAAETQEGCPKS